MLLQNIPLLKVVNKISLILNLDKIVLTNFRDTNYRFIQVLICCNW